MSPTVARVAWMGAFAVAVSVATPLGAGASASDAGLLAQTAAAGGLVYGGLTKGDAFPIVIEVSKNRRQVVRATIGLRLRCSSGGLFTVPDSFVRMPVTKTGKFGATFGPETIRNPDGTTSDLEATVAGKFNASRTKVSGTWHSKDTEHDNTGAVTDTCDSGTVSWSAKD